MMQSFSIRKQLTIFFFFFSILFFLPHDCSVFPWIQEMSRKSVPSVSTEVRSILMLRIALLL